MVSREFLGKKTTFLEFFWKLFIRVFWTSTWQHYLNVGKSDGFSIIKENSYYGQYGENGSFLSPYQHFRALFEVSTLHFIEVYQIKGS